MIVFNETGQIDIHFHRYYCLPGMCSHSNVDRFISNENIIIQPSNAKSLTIVLFLCFDRDVERTFELDSPTTVESFRSIVVRVDCGLLIFAHLQIKLFHEMYVIWLFKYIVILSFP